MALTAQQIVDIRYYMGYSVKGNAAYAPFAELVYSDVSYMGISLDGDDLGVGGRLANLSAEEEGRMTSYFLPNLALRETEIQAASVLLMVDRAGPFRRNAQEVAEREHLFRSLRLALCRFLGFPPGTGLRVGGVVRT